MAYLYYLLIGALAIGGFYLIYWFLTRESRKQPQKERLRETSNQASVVDGLIRDMHGQDGGLEVVSHAKEPPPVDADIELEATLLTQKLEHDNGRKP